MRGLGYTELDYVSAGRSEIDGLLGGAAATAGRGAAAEIIGGFVEGAELGSIGGPLATIGGALVGIGIGAIWYYTE